MSESADAVTNQQALALFSGTDDSAWASERLRLLLSDLEPWAAPPAEIGILVCALAATKPDTIPAEIGDLLAAVIVHADLSRTAQPAVDEAFQLLQLLSASPAHQALPALISYVLSEQHLHPRWLVRTVELLHGLIDWRPEVLDLPSLIAAAEHAPQSTSNALFDAIIGPLLLADPAAFDPDLLQRASDLVSEPSNARYVVNALAENPATEPNVRAQASAMLTNWFPLRAIWRALSGGRGLRLLCIQNIADGQGDELIRVVPLLHAFLRDHPGTQVTLVTDRGYLYQHPRLELISFDEPERISLVLNEQVDVLIEFFESKVPHLNHDTDLAAAVAAMRERHAPLLDLRAGKGWNYFTFDSVQIGGFEWADALQMNRSLDDTVYGPAFRLIAELGLPLAIGTHANTSPILAHQPSPDLLAQRRDDDRSPQRPLALLNPFGGSEELKGFVAHKLNDLLPIVRALIDEGYDVVICPTASVWGSSALIDDLRERLTPEQRRHTSSAPDPTRSTSRETAMRELVCLVARADLVVTIEGWMMHAAYLSGKPYRLLLLPYSGERNWQPWGRERSQRVWYFHGDPVLDQPPCPERPRRAAWLELLNRVNEPCWYDMLRRCTESPDRDIRRAAWRALGRLAPRELRSSFVELLDDRSFVQRAIAAEVLLDRYPASTDGRTNRQALAGYRAVGQVPNGGWEPVIKLNPAALPAIRAAFHDSDPVIRREAAVILEHINRGLEATTPPFAPGVQSERAPDAQ